MVHEVSDLPNPRLHKYDTKKGQRRELDQFLCANVFPHPDGDRVCKGEVIDDICQKCGTWYGVGPDPRTYVKKIQ